MRIDYKKELEAAAKSMILVHNPHTLMRMIVRTIVQKVKVLHAGILLHEEEMDSYVLIVSRGPRDLRIPAGFARMGRENPLIRFFTDRDDKEIFDEGAFVYDEVKKTLKKRIPAEKKELLKEALYQMEIFEAAVSIPTYFRDELLGVLLLGRKRNGKKFLREELDFFIALTSDVAMAIRNARLFQDLKLELERKHLLFLNTTSALAALIEAKDNYTGGHTSRVVNLSYDIAVRLGQKSKKPFDEQFIENLRVASLLHDIGKIGISESILNKEGSLNEEERKKMKGHSDLGATILQPIKELETAVLGIKYHHEWYDGSGYPEGLKGDEIPMIAAIIAVADAFDAMTSNRPYRKGLSREQAVAEIQRLKGIQFSPLVVDVFTELFQEGKV